MAGIDIISDSTGKEIVAAIQSTDVAQARILEINTAAEAKKNEVLESIPEDYSNISKEVDELKSDLVNYACISKPTINSLVAIVNYGTNQNYGDYELEVFRNGNAYGFAYFNEPHDVLFDAYINGDEGVKFLITNITTAVINFVSIRGNDAGVLYSFDRTTNDITVLSTNSCIDNIENNDRVVIHFNNNAMYVCNITKNTLNYTQNSINAFGFVSGGNQGIISKFFIGVKNIYYMISDIVNDYSLKKCFCFGDSITWYDGKIPDTEWTTMKTGLIPIKGYISYLHDLLGLNVTNYGISGETSIQICNRIKNTNFSNVDYCTITAGTNDFLQNLNVGTLQPIGNVQDTESTYYGAVQSAIEYIINNYQDVRIVLISPIRAWKNVKTSAIGMTNVYSNALKDIALLYGLPFVDFYNNIGVNELNKTSYSIDDITNVNVDYYLHPNNYYQMKMGHFLANTMRGY